MRALRSLTLSLQAAALLRQAVLLTSPATPEINRAVSVALALVDVHALLRTATGVRRCGLSLRPLRASRLDCHSELLCVAGHVVAGHLLVAVVLASGVLFSPVATGLGQSLQ